MVHPQRLRTWMLVAVAASVLKCSTDDSAAPPQVILYVDTDAPIASEVLANELKSDASVDTLRVDILGPDNLPLSEQPRDIPAPDVANWPISFGIDGKAGASSVRVRLRAFRARDADSETDPDSGVKRMSPDAGYVIDRIVDVPLPDKGAYAFRVVLQAQCRGSRPDFVKLTTCVDGSLRAFSAGIEALSPEAAHDLSLAPARPAPWIPGKPEDCPDHYSKEQGRVCIPGGFFMLGNRRVVGFGLLRRIDAVPAHPVHMKPFLIDSREMSVKRYRELSGGNGAPLTAKGSGCNGPRAASATENPDEMAINCVTWEEADYACRIAGGRLPSEAEWEYVASGRGRGLPFPWGDDPPGCTTLSAGRKESMLGLEECPTLKQRGAKDPVGTHEQDATSPWKDAPWAEGAVLDLAGSMSEWTNDSFSDYDNDGEPGPNCWARNGMLVHPGCSAKFSEMRSLRGGNWAEPLEATYVALRNAQKGSDRSPLIGFRCVYPLVGRPDPLMVFSPSTGGQDAGSAGSRGDEEDTPSQPEDPSR